MTHFYGKCLFLNIYLFSKFECSKIIDSFVRKYDYMLSQSTKSFKRCSIITEEYKLNLIFAVH